MRKLSEIGGRLVRSIAFAFMFAAVAFATISPVRGAESFPWAMLRIGQVAELSGGASDNDDTLTGVCRTVPEVIAFWHMQIESCPLRRLGTRIIVTAIHPGFDDPKTNAFGKDIPFVEVRAADGRWNGALRVIDIRPFIPTGTHLVLTKVGEGEPSITPHYTSDPKAQEILLGSPVTVEVLEQRAPTGACDLHVRVLSGPQRGRDGWTCDIGTIAGTKLSAGWLN